MGTSDEVNITWTWILQPRHSRHRTTHGSLIGAGFGRQRSLKVFPALAPAAPQAPGLLFVSAIAAAQQCSRFSGDKLDDVGAKPNTLRCRAEAPAVPGFATFISIYSSFGLSLEKAATKPAGLRQQTLLPEPQRRPRLLICTCVQPLKGTVQVSKLLGKEKSSQPYAPLREP